MIPLNKTAALLVLFAISSGLGGYTRQVTKQQVAEKFESEGSQELYKHNDRKAEGYRGIWYRLGRNYEYGDKYSGGLGTSIRPTTPARQWRLTRWTGSGWTTSVISEASHSYDMGSLHVEGNRWTTFLPSGDGPQMWGTGGEVEMWTTNDGGQNWVRQRIVTQNSQYNHMYVRRPVDACDPFFALWADGDTEQAGPSRFYFSNRDGTRVWRLPYTMTEDWETPEEIHAGKE